MTPYRVSIGSFILTKMNINWVDFQVKEIGFVVVTAKKNTG